MTSSFHRRLSILVAGLTLLCPVVRAQEVTILLVNGKTGKPVKNQNVTVTFRWENPARSNRDKWTQIGDWNGTVVHIDQTGAGQIKIPANATVIDLRAGPKMGKEPGRIPYTDCNSGGSLHLEIGTVLQQGFVPGNECSAKLKIRAQPGKIVFFAIPIPWWMPDFQ